MKSIEVFVFILIVLSGIFAFFYIPSILLTGHFVGNFSFSIAAVNNQTNETNQSSPPSNQSNVTVPPVSTPPSTGGGGGGGSGPQTPSSSQGISQKITRIIGSEEENKIFELDREIIAFSVSQGEGEKESIRIRSNFNGPLIISLALEGLPDIFVLDNQTISLNFQETKTVSLATYIPINFKPGVYFGKIKFQLGAYVQEIPIALEVIGKNALFDIKSKISPEDKLFKPRDRVSVKINLENKGYKGEPLDVALYVAIFDFDKKRYYLSSKETVAVDRSLSILREIRVPNELKEGKYILLTTVEYGNLTAESFDILKVRPSSFSSFNFNSSWFWFVFSIVITIAIIILIRRFMLLRED